MTRKELKNYLESLKKEELIKQIIELEQKFKPVKEYYQLHLTKDVSSLLDNYKNQVKNEFFPSRGLQKMRLSVARKAVSEARKIGIPPEMIADLMLFYVETGVQFTLDYGDIEEPFYNSMESMYLSSLKFIKKEGLLPLFETRAERIVTDSADTGWGFSDTLGDYYNQFY